MARPPLARILTLRLLLVAALVVVIDVIAVSLYYGSDVSALQDEVLTNQAYRIAKAAHIEPDGSVTLPEEVTELFHAHPDNYGFVLLDADRNALAGVNAGLLPEPSFATQGVADMWTSRLEVEGGELILRGQLLAIDGIPTTLVLFKAGDPAGLLADAVRNELMGHVVLPVLPVVLALLVANLLLIRRCVRPLAEAAAWARSVVPGRPAAPAPESNLPLEAWDLVHATRRALEELEETLAAEKRRAAEAAHALRTPLAVMTTRLDALPDTADIASLRSDFAGLTRTVSQVLSSARAGALMVAPDARADLSAIASNVVAAQAPLGWRHNVALALEAPERPVFVTGNAGAIETALENLVENAIRHAGASEVQVTIGADGAVTVADDGRGLSAAESDSVFEPFWRGDSAAQGGAGLGLAIVTRVARAHGSTVTYTHRDGGGSEFRLKFRAAAEPD